MRTTLDLPDEIYRQVKARSALEGRPIKAFVTEALVEKLNGTVSKKKAKKVAFPIVKQHPGHVITAEMVKQALEDE